MEKAILMEARCRWFRREWLKDHPRNPQGLAVFHKDLWEAVHERFAPFTEIPVWAIIFQAEIRMGHQQADSDVYWQYWQREATFDSREWINVFKLTSSDYIPPYLDDCLAFLQAVYRTQRFDYIPILFGLWCGSFVEDLDPTLLVKPQLLTDILSAFFQLCVTKVKLFDTMDINHDCLFKPSTSRRSNFMRHSTQVPHLKWPIIRASFEAALITRRFDILGLIIEFYQLTAEQKQSLVDCAQKYPRAVRRLFLQYHVTTDGVYFDQELRKLIVLTWINKGYPLVPERMLSPSGFFDITTRFHPFCHGWRSWMPDLWFPYYRMLLWPTFREFRLVNQRLRNIHSPWLGNNLIRIIELMIISDRWDHDSRMALKKRKRFLTEARYGDNLVTTGQTEIIVGERLQLFWI